MPLQRVIVLPPVNHGLHAILTLFTCGFWLPVWGYLILRRTWHR